MKKLMVIIMLISGLAANVKAQKPAVVLSGKPGWHKIGEITASFKVDKDAIMVLGADRFRAIKLKVTDASIHIYDLEVYYESGDKEDIQVRQDLKKGEETRVIDLKGSDRALKKVVFVYKTIPNMKEEKAAIELYGLK
ncbi:MAG: hypothetical protein ABI855_01955 [Bacteroidota bacterium]